MALKTIIRKILKEQAEEWVDVEPEEYLDLLKYVNGDGSRIKNFPQYKGKKIRILGNIVIDDTEVSNIDSIDYVQGDLDISYTNIEFFDKSKVSGSFRNWGSEMEKIEKRKALQIKYDKLEKLRNSDAWNTSDGDILSYQTEALFQHLKSSGVVDEDEGEDKYFIYPDYESGFDQHFTWFGSKLFESEWVVIREDKIYEAAYNSLKDTIDEVGYESFSAWVWEDYLDRDEIKRWLYDSYSEMVWDDPESWGIEKQLSNEQQKMVETFESRMEKLNYRLENEELTDDENTEIEDQISSIEDIIKDIKEDPKGEYDENEIEDAVERLTDEVADDFPDYLKNHGFHSSYILNFVDIDEVIDYVIRSDGYGSVLNRYDGSEDQEKVEGTWFYVMREH
jgi:hypothetical protein